MDHTIYMVTIFCLINDWLKDKRLRQRGPQPKLADPDYDAEVLALEKTGKYGTPV